MTSLRQQAVSAALWSFVQTWGSRIASLAIISVLARELSAAAFGVFALGTVAVGLAQTLQDQGFSQAIVQRKDLDEEHLDSAFWIALALGLVTAGVLYGVAGLLATAVDQPTLAPVLRWLAPTSILFGLESVQTAVMRRDLRFRALAVRQFGATIAGGLAGIALALDGFGVEALVGQMLVGSTVAVVLMWSVSGWRPRLRFSVVHARELVSFGTYATGLSLMSLVNQRLDDVLIGTVLGARALGFYSVAYRILLILADLFVNVINAVALPVFSKLQSEAERARRALSETLSVLSAVAMPTFALTCVFAPLVVTVLFGHRWAPSAPVLRVLAIVGMFQAVNFVIQWYILAMGAKRAALSLNAVNAAANVVGFAVAVHWGITAVAIAFTVRAYALFPLTVRALRRLRGYGWSDIGRAVAPPATGCVALAVAGVIWNVFAPTWPALPTLVVGAAVALSAYCLALRRIAPGEWQAAIALGRRYVRVRSSTT